jgi:hypothetical protein
VSDVIDNPAVYVGVLAGRDDVAVVLEPGTSREQRICFAPLVALTIARELIKYGQRQVNRQLETVARHEHNTAPTAYRELRKLDS